MTDPISSSGKAAFDQCQFSIQHTMENETTGNLAFLKVKVQDGKEVGLKKAIDFMVKSFEELSPSQQKDEIHVLKERLSYIKSHVSGDHKGAKALLKAVETYEQKFSAIDDQRIGALLLTGGTAFQNKICQLNTTSQMNVLGIATPQSNGDVLLQVSLPDAPSRFFVLQQNEHDKAITLSELGNPEFCRTIRDDDNTLDVVILFKNEIGKEMINAKNKMDDRVPPHVLQEFHDEDEVDDRVPPHVLLKVHDKDEMDDRVQPHELLQVHDKDEMDDRVPSYILQQVHDKDEMDDRVPPHELLQVHDKDEMDDRVPPHLLLQEAKATVAEVPLNPALVNKTFGTDQEIINSCYQPNLSAKDAKDLLKEKPEGTYLLRESTFSKGTKILCFFDSENLYTEIFLVPKQHGGWTAVQEKPIFNQFFTPGDFGSMEAVINSSSVLKNNLKQPLTKSDSEIIIELNQGKDPGNKMLAPLLSEPKGTYYMKEAAVQGCYLFVCSEGNGYVKTIGVKPDPKVAGGWITYADEPGKKFGSLNEVLKYPGFKEYMTAPKLPVKTTTAAATDAQFVLSPFNQVTGPTASAQAVAPSIAKTFSYQWGIKASSQSASMHKTQISQAKPEELLGMASNGIKVSGEEFLSAAEKLKATIPSIGEERGPQLTTLHDLYCRAADKFEAAGDIEKAFEARANAASFAGPAASSKLHSMSQAVTNGQQAQKSTQFPAHFSGLDTGILKGGSLRASNRTIKGNALTQLEFKLSKFARHNVQGHLVNIQNNLAAFEASLPPELKGKVRITEVEDTFLGKKSDGSFSIEDGYTPAGARAIQIEFEGVGTVVVGNSKKVGCFYDNVKVLVKAGLPEGKAVQQVHQMLTMLGIGPIMNEQRPIDEERLKIALIFRAYYPQQAIKMERTKEFYEMPLDMLKQKIEAAVPDMKNVFKKYENSPALIQKKDIYPGQTTFALTDISAEMRTKGAYGLMSGVGYQQNASDAADTVVLMIKNGALSSQDRFQAGLFAKGASSETDLCTGGGDHVFTRLINPKTDQFSLGDKFGSGSSFLFSGKYQMLYDLDVCNSGAYGYDKDLYGVKNPDHANYIFYEKRENLQSLAEKACSPSNEIMVKNSVPPDLIRGIVCQNQANKDLLVQKLKAEGVIVNGKINGCPFDSFIHVATKFKKEMWNKPPEAPPRLWVDDASSYDPSIPSNTAIANKTLSGSYKSERAQVHRDIKSQIIGNAKPVSPGQKPVAMIMMGPPGAGKSMAINQITKGSDQFVEVGMDNVMERLPEYKKAINLGTDPNGKIITAKNACLITREEAGDITTSLRQEVISSRRNMIYDGTGQNFPLYKKMIEKLKAEGYEVQVYYLDIDVEQAKQRAKDRAEVVGRLVPEDVVVSIYHNAKANFKSIAALADTAVLFDNRSPPPKQACKYEEGTLVEGQQYLSQKGF